MGSIYWKSSKINPKNIVSSSNLKFDLYKLLEARHHNIVNEKNMIKCTNLSISNNWNLEKLISGTGINDRIISNKV